MALEPDNSVAGEAILYKLNRVAQMAESLDNVLKEIGVLCQADGLSSWSNVEEGAEPAKNRNNRSASEDSTAKCSSDQESAVTAPLWNPQSRSSSYHTASECRSSPWWDSEKNSDLEAESNGMVRIRPAGTSSASNSFDESDQSLMSTSFQCDSDESPKTPLSHRDDGEEEEEEEETSSSTISQTSRKPSIIQNEKVIIDESGKLSVETITPVPASVSPIIITETSAKVSGNENDRQPDFMAWNRYYQSLINKQTLRSCL